jgi:hypothetical protein
VLPVTVLLILITKPQDSVLRIRDNLARIRIRGSVPLSNRSKFFCLLLSKVHLHFSKLKVIKKSQNQCSGSGSAGSTCFWASRIRIRILLSSCKNSRKNLDSYHFVTLFDFLSLKNYVNVPLKSNKQKNCVKIVLKISFLLAS